MSFQARNLNKSFPKSLKCFINLLSHVAIILQGFFTCDPHSSKALILCCFCLVVTVFFQLVNNVTNLQNVISLSSYH